jgi:hypothetical protein
MSNFEEIVRLRYYRESEFDADRRCKDGTVERADRRPEGEVTGAKASDERRGLPGLCTGRIVKGNLAGGRWTGVMATRNRQNACHFCHNVKPRLNPTELKTPLGAALIGSLK